jgi:hypothetical protein
MTDSGSKNSGASTGQTNGRLFTKEFSSKMLIRCYPRLQKLSKDESLYLGSLGSQKKEILFGSVRSKMRFFETEKPFLISAQKKPSFSVAL